MGWPSRGGIVLCAWSWLASIGGLAALESSVLRARCLAEAPADGGASTRARPRSDAGATRAPSTPRATAASPSARKRGAGTVVPSTSHVHAEIPPGLQADLDADPRMQSWLDGALAVIDRCHAAAGRPAATLTAALTMHESARPDLALGALPPTLAQVVACASAPLLRTRMPLFTGREGTRYALRMVFR